MSLSPHPIFTPHSFPNRAPFPPPLDSQGSLRAPFAWASYAGVMPMS